MVFSWWRKLVADLGRPGKACKTSLRHGPPELEGLEDRVTPTATGSALFTSLDAFGTPGTAGTVLSGTTSSGQDQGPTTTPGTDLFTSLDAFGTPGTSGTVLSGTDPTATFGVEPLSARISSVGTSTNLFNSLNGSGTPGTPGTILSNTDHLALTVQPPNSISSGEQFEVQVAVEDSSGNVDTTFNGAVTLSLAGNSAGGTLSGILFKNAINGVADFLLTLDKAGTGYSVKASTPGLSAVTTNSFSVTTNQLVVGIEPPGSVAVNQPFAVQLMVLDGNGNQNVGYNGNVTIALASNPGGAALGGTLTVAAQGGLVSFTGLTLNEVGSGYTLKISGPGISPTTTSAFDVAANPTPLSINVTSLPQGTAGSLYFQTITASGGLGTQLLTVNNVSGSISGLNLPSSGVGSLQLLGVPLAAGTLKFTVTAIDTLGDTTSRNYTLTINPPISLSQQTLAVGDVGVAYSQTIKASGGTGTKTLTLSNITGSIPGLAIPPSGTNSLTFQGKATVAGSVTFTLTATDANAVSTSQTYTLTINPAVALSPSNLPQGTTGTAYSQTITANGGTGNKGLTVSNITDSIPGITIPPSGTNSLTISGTPTGPGTVSFTVEGVDTLNGTGTQRYTITVNPPVVLSTPTLPDGTNLLPYSQTITASGGTGDKALLVSNLAGSIPGITIPPSGTNSLTISGSPTATGVVSFDLTATDAAGATTTHHYTLTVDAFSPTGGVSSAPPPAAPPPAAPPPAATPPAAPPPAAPPPAAPPPAATPLSLGQGSLPVGTAGAAYSQTISATGTGAVALAVSNLTGSIPGLTIPTSGTNSLAISGSPTGAGTVSFTVTATDSTGSTMNQNYTVTINPAPTLGSAGLPAGTAGSAYSQTIAVSGGIGDSTLTVSNVAGSIPGLTIPTSGTDSLSISGTPTAAGSVSFTVTATDADNVSTTQKYTLTVNPAAATQLVFTSQPPASMSAGKATPLTIQAQDALGDVDTSFNGIITLSLAGTSGTAGLGGTISVTAKAGVATFSNVLLGTAGTGYTLQASAAGLPAATSNSFSVTPGAPAGLTFTTQPPASVTAGAGLGVTLQAVDASGNAATNFNGTVTLSLASNPGSSTLAGTISAQASGGVVSFNGVWLNKAGSGYVLQASSAGITGSSSAFSVTPGAATQLVFTPQPPLSIRTGIPVSIIVKAEDSFGNVDTSFNGPVNLSLASNPGNGVLRGVVSVRASAGTAVFRAVSITRPGVGYALKAVSGSLGAVSNGFIVRMGIF